MGNIERRGKARARKRNLHRAILGAVSVTGLLAVALVAPNLPAALKRLGMLPTGSKDVGTINRARNTLLAKGLLSRTKDGYLELTESGRLELARTLSTDRTRRAPRWDGRWRVLIFDIPEKRRLVRDRMRLMLKDIGFILLQDSVWAYPYDCEEIVALIKTELQLGSRVLYMIVDEMEGDSTLRRRFGL